MTRGVRCLVSGGQTGADRAALVVAEAIGLAYDGWVPAGGWAEDHPRPPGIRATYPCLKEGPADPAARTGWNVRDSDAVLVLGDPTCSPGTRLTVAEAERLGRPLLVADPWSAGAPVAVAEWLARIGPRRLDVAGPRESEQPGLEAAAQRLLRAVLR